MKKKKGGGGGGSNWMDTYGDMVTLLLCFFVLMYSMSTVDQEKWLQVVRSFNPDAIKDETATSGNQGPLADPFVDEELGAGKKQVEIDQMMDELYLAISQYIEEQGAAESISATKGDGYVFISLNNAVFFDGDSYVLRSEGARVLDDVGGMLQAAGDAIDELRILGHTAQATGDRLNNETTDRFLASNRATVVLLYLQEMEIVDPARIVSIGYGQWRPVAPNDTAEGKAANRRVEMLITAKDVTSEIGDSLAQYYTFAGIDTDTLGEDDPTEAPTVDTPEAGENATP